MKGLSVSIEERRRVTLVHEDEEEGNRTWVIAVPGLLAATKAITWDSNDNSIAVYEIFWYLLKSHYEESKKHGPWKVSSSHQLAY